MSKKTFFKFIDNIPDSKLEAFPPRNGHVKMYTEPKCQGQNYRLDKQGVCRCLYSQLLARQAARRKNITKIWILGHQLIITLC